MVTRSNKRVHDYMTNDATNATENNGKNGLYITRNQNTLDFL